MYIQKYKEWSHDHSLKADLIRALIDAYGIIPKSDMTFSEAFAEWVEYKRMYVSADFRPMSPSTIRRYERDYNRLIEDSNLAKLPINTDSFSLRKELIKIVKIHKMTLEEFSNLFGYVSGVFDMLLDNRMISASPISKNMKKEVRCFCTESKQRSDDERILSMDELEGIRCQAELMAKKHPYYTPNYAIILASMTGMRVGELSALHWTDIDDEYIHVDCSEHRNDYADHSELVIGEPKNRKHRKIPMTRDICNLFNRVKELGIDSEWIFARKDGSRYTAHDISCACDRRAKEIGLDGSSIHEIRRTVSSYLRTIITREAVASLLGHRPETNDQHYDYDISTYSDKINALEALSPKVTRFPGNKKTAEAL